MCFVSLISTDFDNTLKPGNITFTPFTTWPDPQVLAFADVIKRLDAIDKALKLRDCKDAEKEKFLAALDARVKAIETKKKKKRVKK